MIKLFVGEVERHHAEKDVGSWSLNTYKDGMLDVNHDFADVQLAFEHAGKYETLSRKVLLAMRDVTIRMNYQTHELEIVK